MWARSTCTRLQLLSQWALTSFATRIAIEIDCNKKHRIGSALSRRPIYSLVCVCEQTLLSATCINSRINVCMRNCSTSRVTHDSQALFHPRRPRRVFHILTNQIHPSQFTFPRPFTLLLRSLSQRSYPTKQQSHSPILYSAHFTIIPYKLTTWTHNFDTLMSPSVQHNPLHQKSFFQS